MRTRRSPRTTWRRTPWPRCAFIWCWSMGPEHFCFPLAFGSWCAGPGHVHAILSLGCLPGCAPKLPPSRQPTLHPSSTAPPDLQPSKKGGKGGAAKKKAAPKGAWVGAATKTVEGDKFYAKAKVSVLLL